MPRDHTRAALFLQPLFIYAALASGACSCPLLNRGRPTALARTGRASWRSNRSRNASSPSGRPTCVAARNCATPSSTGRSLADPLPPITLQVLSIEPLDLLRPVRAHSARDLFHVEQRVGDTDWHNPVVPVSLRAYAPLCLRAWRGARSLALAARMGRVAPAPRSDRPVARAPGSDCPLLTPPMAHGR